MPLLNDYPGPRAPVDRVIAAATALAMLLPAFAGSGQAFAADVQDAWALCRPLPTVDLPPPDRGDRSLNLIADEVSFDRGGVSRLFGNVLITEGGRQLRADEAVWREESRIFEARGNILYRDDLIVVESPEATVDLDADEGEFRHAEYRVPSHHVHGRADRIARTGSDRSRLLNATYSTCDPDRVDWQLVARDVRLDHAEGEGPARNVTLRIGDVPVFYTPWISFPLDDRRKSGLLVPRIGGSDESGLDIEIPWYWNIAPHRDATIGPRILGKRGVMLRSEFRYLNPDSQGEIHLDYLPDDALYHDDRHLLTFRHRDRLTPRLALDIDVNTASDADYFRDFGGSLSGSSTLHLKRQADLWYRADHWSLRGRVQNYQTLDRSIAAANRPYQRLPQLLFNGRWPYRQGAVPVDFGMRTEWVSFERDNSTEGRRLDLAPSVSLPMAGAGWHLTPKVQYRYTQYDLTDTAPGTSTSPTRTLPVLSVDAGLQFERPLGDGRFQTLEPRLYYLSVPYRNQEDIPVFDTGLHNFSFVQMFLDNRFNGADRVGDADQVTTMVTTRLIEGNNGAEILRAGIGQIFHFRDRRVTLPGQSVERESRSSLVAEGMAHLGRGFDAGAAIQWSASLSRTEQSAAWLRYRDGSDRLANLAYRFREDEIEQTDLSAAWPLSRRWRAVARWNYSLRTDRDLETLAGLEYESCCWRLHTVVRRYLVDEDGEYNNGIYFQLILKGLTSVGTRIDQLLDDRIPGYVSD